ncbi:uncharacterized protein B0H18DRAFT_1190077 [Fomitopsis serialis]|uniref:uncharacterized protein n=1 Tax=Fomitopsis serialis TaxID=139415 RepID=UPI002008B5FA|nr:uncharacterized protein B0H18DRAFT_1190077 [Neoantrodia serialis]KAH9921026.1 hypothetical protein B0H18DRAFT_1190077 [Neoantrodia serialis]
MRTSTVLSAALIATSALPSLAVPVLRSGDSASHVDGGKHFAHAAPEDYRIGIVNRLPVFSNPKPLRQRPIAEHPLEGVRVHVPGHVLTEGGLRAHNSSASSHPYAHRVRAYDHEELPVRRPHTGGAVHIAHLPRPQAHVPNYAAEHEHETPYRAVPGHPEEEHFARAAIEDAPEDHRIGIIHRIPVGTPANRLRQHPIERPIEGVRFHAPSHSASEGGLHARAYGSLVARKDKKGRGKAEPAPAPAPASNTQTNWNEANTDIQNAGTAAKDVGGTVKTVVSVGRDVASVLGDFSRREEAARELEDWIVARTYNELD